jgi:hypothetical protein
MQPSPNLSYEQLPHLFMKEYLPIGKRLVIAGTAEKGALYQPVQVSSEEQAKYLFGSGTLLDRYTDAKAGATPNVYLMRIERNAFQDVYRALAPFSFDLIYIQDLTFNKFDEMLRFVDFAKEKEQQGQLIHGFFEVDGPNGMEAYRALFPYIAQLSIPTEDGIEETGKYISPVADQFKDRKAAAVYAGLVTALDIGLSPINKTIDTIELKREYENDQIVELRKAGMVCFRKSFKKGVVCASATCAVATEGSVHKHISNFRIAQDTIQEVAEEQRAYIGRVGVSYVISELEEIIEVALLYRVKLGQLRRYDFEVTADPLTGVINTQLELIPIFSVQKMNATSLVRVRA